MDKRNPSYCIIKLMDGPKGNKIRVIMVRPGDDEILEYSNEEKAQEMADLLTTNSDSGWEYIVKKI